MAMERESSPRLDTVLGNYLGGHSPVPGLSWNRSARGLKWVVVFLTAMLALFGLVTLTTVRRRDLPPAAGSSLAESIALLQRPGAYAGADLAWAELSQGELVGANLQRTALLGADLSGANLRQAHLDGASLLGANLGEAHLQEATLSRADLRRAYLGDADLRGADLRWSNLAAANLEYATLSGASLTHANMNGAQLQGATLPDGSRWTPSSNLARFTNPAHPDFWRAEDHDTVVFPLKHLPELPVMR